MHSARRLCRLCAKSFEVSSLLHIFHNNKPVTGSLDLLIKRYMPFPVSIDDSLSQYVCKLCCAHVVRWHKFLVLCVKAQAELKDMQEKLLGKPMSGNSSCTEEDKVEPLNLESQIPVTDFHLATSTITDQSKLYNTARRKKSNYCIARWCNNSNNMGIPFFRVPKDRKRALQWLSAADRMDLADKDVAYLYGCYMCATHFVKEMFVNENCKSLNRYAVPSIFSRPIYAQKIDEALSTAETYPKELQGVRLKNILPKSLQMSQEISTEGSLSLPQTSRSYGQLIRLVREPHQKLENPMQEVLFVRDSMPSHSNIQIISMFPVAEDIQKTVQVMEVQDSRSVDQSQVLTSDGNGRLGESISSTSVKEVFESSENQIHSQKEQEGGSTFVCDNFQSDTNYLNDKEISKVDESGCESAVLVDDKQSPFRNNINTLANPPLEFNSGETYNDGDTVMMLDLDRNPTDTKDGLTVMEIKTISADQHITSDSLDLHGIPSEDSLTSNIAIAPSYSLANPSSLIQGSLSFTSKESTNKNGISNCLGNIVGSQDFLLMHSSSDHIEEARNHGFRQDKNLNNLCCTIVREPASETPVVYGERSMMAEASVRTIECTSPNHGQIIEGLIDFDQFLDSG